MPGLLGALFLIFPTLWSIKQSNTKAFMHTCTHANTKICEQQSARTRICQIVRKFMNGNDKFESSFEYQHYQWYDLNFTLSVV